MNYGNLKLFLGSNLLQLEQGIDMLNFNVQCEIAGYTIFPRFSGSTIAKDDVTRVTEILQLNENYLNGNFRHFLFHTHMKLCCFYF